MGNERLVPEKLEEKGPEDYVNNENDHIVQTIT
jgi:hypothetical protein